MIDELRSDVTKTRKDGSRGRLKIDYGDHRDPQAAIAWLWRFLDGATSAGELYGRALVIIAAEQYASRLVVPSGQRMPATRWSSHKDIAAKALKKLAGPHLPATLSGLERAVKRAHAAYDKAETAAREQQRAERQPVEPSPRTASATTSTRTSTRPRSPAAARWRADPPPEDGTPWRACGWRGIGPPAGRAAGSKGAPSWPSPGAGCPKPSVPSVAGKTASGCSAPQSSC